ncbi:unnamed protein product [Hymenolepis diminuta]|uniref:Uncharacterized protein n=1 Tax=Hymenolepis diminuta TaxID=6216 RepID=A0A564YRB1_HYMDI|nr:unnamed protein product [Hymenolepis diminuta]
MTDHPSTERPAPNPTFTERTSEPVALKMSVLWRTSLSSRLSFRRRSCQNCNENFHKEGFYGESFTSSSTRQNPNDKRALIQTRLIQFPDENDTHQAPTLEHTIAENLLRGCNQSTCCRNFSSFYSNSISETRFSGFAKGAKQISHPCPQQTRGVPEMMVMERSTRCDSTFLFVAEFSKSVRLNVLRKSID